MPIKIPNDLPARLTLESEGVMVMTEDSAHRQDIRPLRIGLLNLMPNKIRTETQFARLIGATPLQVELSLIKITNHKSKNTPTDHMIAFYRDWEKVRKEKFDGLIITGAPIELLEFEEVTYWDELQRIFDWTQTHVHSTFNICWGAQAALYHFHHVPKHTLAQKAFGIYRHKNLSPASPYLRGFSDDFSMPVSRWTENWKSELPRDKGLEVLMESEEAGLCFVADDPHRQLYMFNHIEYDTNTLGEEYRRDSEAGKNLNLPANYFPGGNTSAVPENRWRSHAHLLFGNWINEVYQSTPYALEDIGKRIGFSCHWPHPAPIMDGPEGDEKVRFQNVIDASRIAAGGLMDLATGLVNPTLRLGVTGLSRSGKTVFITAMVHALTKGTRLPVFEAHAQGRITRAYLEPQPDDDLPRFAYEDHLQHLTSKDRSWPESTRRISQLRLTLEYEPRGLIARNFQSGKLHIDIVDYPGEWLLDLPLMNMTYRQWSETTIAASHVEPRATLAKAWHVHLATLDAVSPAKELNAVKAAELFTAYLAKCREDDVALSSLLPGRFLMPGDFAGSPLLTFAPLNAKTGQEFPKGSLGDLMERRYDSYVSKIVRPFFFSHFARLDRQIVLVDALSALNAGPAAVQDLKTALTQVMACFRLGANSVFSRVLGRRIDRILFAATKADLLHQTSHDRLENILRLIIEDAGAKAEFSGARIDVAALAAIRATREAKVKQKNEELPCIAGVPQKGEKIGNTAFDGESEVAIFPGDLPANSLDALDGTLQGKLKFVRFRPPPLKDGAFPHIRLDRSLEFLLGDRLA